MIGADHSKRARRRCTWPASGRGSGLIAMAWRGLTHRGPVRAAPASAACCLFRCGFARSHECRSCLSQVLWVLPSRHAWLSWARSDAGLVGGDSCPTNACSTKDYGLVTAQTRSQPKCAASVRDTLALLSRLAVGFWSYTSPLGTRILVCDVHPHLRERCHRFDACRDVHLTVREPREPAALAAQCPPPSSKQQRCSSCGARFRRKLNET